MPIRINLLAEAQAIEEGRRRDPVKRSIYVASALIVMVLVWVASLQVKIMADNAGLKNLESRLNAHTNDYNQILLNKATLAEVETKLAGLNRLAANRFLQATLLNSLMHAPVEGIQITHLRTDQAVEAVAEVKSTTEKGKPSGGKPAGAVEHIKLILDAKDTSANPGGDQINKFKDTLSHTPYFEFEQISTNHILLKNLSTPMLDNDSGKPYVMFSFECTYPDRVR